MNTDYYKILGIEKTASHKEIKSAFRVLAHKHHPDKGGDEKEFKSVNEAYQVLSDEKKRTQYDRFGSAENGFSGFSGGQSGFNAQYAQYYSQFAGGGSGRQFNTINFKKIPLVGWLLLLPFIAILALVGLVIACGLLVRTVSRSLSR